MSESFHRSEPLQGRWVIPGHETEASTDEPVRVSDHESRPQSVADSKADQVQ